MMEREAIVTRVEDGHAYVEVGGASAGCGRCHEAGGCQNGLLGQLFRARPRLFRIPNPIGAVPGEHVVVSVADGAALRAILPMYVLPVACLLLGAVAGTALAGAGQEDAAAALGALAGLLVAVPWGLTLRRTPLGRIAQPVLLRRSPFICISKEVRQ